MGFFWNQSLSAQSIRGQSHTAPCWCGCAVSCQSGLDFKFCKLEKYEAVIMILLVEEEETHNICHTDVPAAVFFPTATVSSDGNNGIISNDVTN